MKKQVLFLIVNMLTLLIFSRKIQAHNVPGKTVIHMQTPLYDPQNVQINQGDTVVFENVDQEEHWPASNIHPTHQIYPEFDPKQPVKPNTSWSFTFTKAGSWKYHDHLLPATGGTITVAATGTNPSPSPQPKPTPLHQLKISLLKFYYKLFPKELEKQLATFDAHAVATQPDKLQYWLEITGGQKYMEKLIADSGGGALVDCHQEAHRVGRSAYDLFGAPVFKNPGYECHSGFLHGAMEAFLQDKGTQALSKNITSLCKQLPTNFGIFECLHGVGHGVMAYENFDLPAALTTCNKLADGFSQSSCYGGVFMENIVSGQGQGATPDHISGWLSNDLQYPCNAISQDDTIQQQCYMMQTSRMFDISKYDTPTVIKGCDAAPQKWQPTCFRSFGRDIAGQTLRNPQKILDKCTLVDQSHFEDCIAGALNVIIDFWGGKLNDQASQLCRIVPLNHKSVCYGQLAGRLTDIFKSPADQARICASFETEYQGLCPKPPIV